MARSMWLAVGFVMMIFGSAAAQTPTNWEWCGWGGGGFFWATAYHPTKPGVIYMGGDCAGMYKSEDDGKNWRMINNGLIDYAVYGIAVDAKSPDTVYALTESGTCKSTDAGEHWVVLPETVKGKLGILADRHVSVRPMAADPSNSDVVYAATPAGKIFKSGDGATSWKEVYQVAAAGEMPADALRAEFPPGPPFYGGLFFPVIAPKEAVKGFGMSFKANGEAPRTAHIVLMTAGGAVYRCKNLSSLMEKTDWQEIVLGVEDFEIDPDQAKQKKEQSANWPKQVDLKTVNRMDLACSGMPKPLVVFVRGFYFAGEGGKKISVKDFAGEKKVNTYGGLRTGGPKAPALASVSVSSKNPQLVMAASPQAGVFISRDGGKTWEPAAGAPKSAQCVIADPKDANVLYGAFGTQGVHKSVDGGKTWSAINDGVRKDVKIMEIAVSPANSNEIVCIGEIDWNGFVFWSDNGGQKWAMTSKLTADLSANPTFGMGNISRPTNVTYCPTDAKKLFISSNWRPVFSEDGGRTWRERDRGADISCVYDLRFSGKRVYAACMDEGVLWSEDGGKQWQQAWPKGPEAAKIAGHYWRLAVSQNNGVDRIVSSCSPWNATQPNCVVLSEDGAKSFKIINGAGLPNYKPNGNTMWGQSYPRAMAADPKDPKVIYMGMDGDAEGGKSGGGIFKSVDGGYTWKQLANQPGSRRMFMGLVVDPTDSKRLYWGACGNGGGLWRSEDGGESWKHVFKNETWIFNVLVTADGTVYAPGKDMWRSDDHGNTWKKLTNWSEGQIIAMESHPRDPKTMWYCNMKHGGTAWGHIMKTTDGGKTWTEITGDIGYRKPVVLRFNEATNELWAAGVGIFRTKNSE